MPLATVVEWIARYHGGLAQLTVYTLKQMLHLYYLGIARERREASLALSVTAVGSQGDGKIINQFRKDLGAEG